MTTADRCQGMTWQQVRDAGLLGTLIAETGFGYKRLAKRMGWAASQCLRQACQAAAGVAAQPVVFPVALDALPKEAEITGLSSDLANNVYRWMHRNASEKVTVADLADKFDRSPRSVADALQQIRQAGYCLDILEQDDGEQVTRLARQAPAHAGRTVQTGWGETTLRLGYLSDTHFGSLNCCLEEIGLAYDKFAAEGITDVLHSGDLVDGSGRLGFPGHAAETRDDCYTARQLAAHTVREYPARAGIITHFIESAKSHAGWDLSRDGFSFGHALANGFDTIKQGPLGTELHHHPGRPDMRFLGYDDATLGVGPEGKTLVHLLHPDGGTAYALSYQPQKWAEMLEGGSKPHVALLGHYHKLNWIRTRNIQLVTGECMCWQTPFMRRKRIAAHVGFLILEMTLDADGTVRSFLPREFPFFLGEKRTFDLGAGEVA